MCDTSGLRHPNSFRFALKFSPAHLSAKQRWNAFSKSGSCRRICWSRYSCCLKIIWSTSKFQTAARLVTCAYFKRELLQLLNISENYFWDVSMVSDPGIQQSVCKSNLIWSRVIRAFQISVTLFALVLAIWPFFGRKLSVGSYSENDSHVIGSLYCVVMQISILYDTLLLPSFDMIYIGTCTGLATQFRIVGQFLKEINSNNNDWRSDDTNKFIEHHNILLR